MGICSAKKDPITTFFNIFFKTTLMNCMIINFRKKIIFIHIEINERTYPEVTDLLKVYIKKKIVAFLCHVKISQ